LRVSRILKIFSFRRRRGGPQGLEHRRLKSEFRRRERRPKNYIYYLCPDCKGRFGEEIAHRIVTLYGIFVRCPSCGFIMKVVDYREGG